MRKYFSIFLILFLVSAINAQDLFFSEYIEGSSNNKAIEIFNPTSSDVDLSNYRVVRANNGSATYSDSLVLSGTLASGDVFVIANPSANTAILDVSDITSTLTYYNGDDFMGIQKLDGTTWVDIDVIGVLGVDPGTNWTVGATGATSEFTLVRKPSISSGTTDWAASAGTTDDDSQWLIYPQDTFDYIGAHTMDAAATELFFSEYLEGSSNNKAIEIYNPTGADVDLSSYRVIRANNGATALSDSAVLSGTLASGDVYVIGNASAAADILNVTDLTSTLTYFNGDDFMGLQKFDGSVWVTIDVVGLYGEDPGAGWEVAGVADATANHTLVRKSTVGMGNTDWTASAGTDANDSEWIVYDSDTFTYLGSHEYGSGQADNAPVIASVTGSVLVPTADETLTVTAEVTDDNAVSSVKLYYAVNGGSEVEVAMSNTSGDMYSADIPASAYGDGDMVQYYVMATDDASQSTSSNTSSFFAGTTDISTVSGTTDFVSTYKGAYARVNGDCSAESGVYQVSNMEVYIQDATAGINVFMFSTGPDFTFVRGNNYTVVGKIDQFNGKMEIIPDAVTDITDNGAGSMVQFKVLTIAELLANAEMYENQLIGIVGVSLVGGTWPADGSSASLTISDNGTDELALRIDSDTDIDGSVEPTWPKDIVGIFSQYDSQTPPNSGYQLLPRDLQDFYPEATIPVELTSFTATALEGSVNLSWSTATETNNSGFEVQKSKEDKTWEKVAFVEGNGTTTEVSEYTYTEENVAAGTYTYRIKQIDFDGTVSYSKEVEVEVAVPLTYELSQNFPNPFNPTTNIRFSIPEQANVKITVYTVLGQEVATLVNQSMEAGVHKINFNASNLNSGVYYYRIKTDKFTAVKKMMLVK